MLAAKLLQSCPTLCDPRNGSPPGSPIPGILQARTLEWVAISFFNAWKWKVKGKLLSHVRLLATPWTAAHQAPQYMGFSKQEYWSRLPLPSPIKCLDQLNLESGAQKSVYSLFPQMILMCSYALHHWYIPFRKPLHESHLYLDSFVFFQIPQGKGTFRKRQFTVW